MSKTYIATEADFRKIGSENTHPLDAHYELSADITLESEWSPIGSDTDRFTGTFDGAGHRISGLKIVAPTTNHVGLFAALGGGSEVRNLTIEDAHIEGDDYVGVLAGVSYGSIENLAIEDGTVSGAERVGGLVGYAHSDSSISECYATGSVSGGTYVGGLVGYAHSDSSISESYATGSVSGAERVGGLVGFASSGSSISESYATGSVSGDYSVGGLVGYAYGNSISESYATGSVSGGSFVGGLVGEAWASSSISESYFDVHLSGQAEGIGSDQRNESTGVSGYDSSSATLQYDGAEVTRTDFAGWNFSGSDAVWRWVQGRWPQLAAFSEEQQTPLASNAEAADISISSEEELRKIGIDDAYPLDAHYTLTSNIDLTAPIEPIGVNARSFTGHFDGAGHRITGLDIRRPGGHFTGLFSQIAATGRIWDLRISSPHIEGGNHSGALAGRSFGSIENLAIEGGTVSGASYVGGLVGRASGHISESYATGSVSGDDRVGGLVGRASGHISESYATGTVSGDDYVGGLVGSTDGDISESYATGSVSGDERVGGLVGSTDGDISESYATGSVSGDGYVGGLVGWNIGEISESYATGSVSGSWSVGGLVGRAWSSSSISECYFDVHLSGQEEGIGSDQRDESTGVIGYDSSSTTLQRNGAEVTRADFAGWDFAGSDAVWRWVQGQWPLLAWQPILISTEEELRKIGSENTHPLDAHYELSADITLESEWSPIGSDTDPFTGTFDGAGHCISNLKIVAPTTNHVGLFAVLGGGSEVRNLTIEDAHIEGNNYVGVLAGRSYGNVEKLGVTDSVISGKNQVGGLLGKNDGILAESYAIAVTSGDEYVGGLAGQNNGRLEESYSISSVLGAVYIGGLVGIAYDDSSIAESYASSLLAGRFVGGLAGRNHGSITASYFSSRGGEELAGLGIDYNDQSAGITACDESSATLQSDGSDVTQSSFDDWDFSAAWRWVENGKWAQLAAFPADQQIVVVSTPQNINIANEEDLRKIGVDDAYPLDAHYTLTGDIMLSDSFELIGLNGTPLTGVFDGGDHRIENLRLDREERRFNGLFSQIASTGIVRNLTISAAQIEGGDYSGVLAGRSYGRVEKVTVSAALVSGGEDVGGLVGWSSGSIAESQADAEVSGEAEVGGLTGSNDGSIIDSKTSISSRGARWIAGLVGKNYGSIEASFSDSEVNATDDYVGGLVGRNYGSITESYANGQVEGKYDCVGGLAGASSGRISESYATGTIVGSGDYVGGFVGWNEGETETSFATGSVSGNSDVGGFVGRNDSSITESYTYATITGMRENIGGFAGYADSGSSISESYFDTNRSNTLRGVGTGSSEGLTAYTSISGTLQTDGEDVTRADFAGWGFSGNNAVWSWQGEGRWPIHRPQIAYVLIGTGADLRKIGRDDAYPLDGYYILSADITLEEAWNPLGTESDTFTGTFDGAGHSISGLTIAASDEDHVGFFSVLGEGATVRNLVLELAAYTADASSIEGENYVGALAGRSYGSIITNVAVRGGSIRGVDYIGGLVGHIDAGSSLVESFATTALTGNDNVGGLAGRNDGSIEASYSQGVVTGDRSVGGVAGYVAEAGSIAECYAESAVSGRVVGGIVGYAEEQSSITASYFDTHRTGQSADVGEGASTSTAYDSAAGTLQHNGADVTQSQFSGWQFTGDDGVWRWVEDGQWPRLADFSPDQQSGVIGAVQDIDIESAEDLRKIGVADTHPLDAHYTLTSDITLEDSFVPIGIKGAAFSGHFDGGGYRIEGLQIVAPDQNYVGMFSQIASSGVVQNLTLDSAKVAGRDYTGTVAGRCYGSVRGLAVHGELVSRHDYVGGIAGENCGSIEMSCVYGVISGDDSVGGLVGRNGGSIEASYSQGMIIGDLRVGGLVGHAYSEGLIKQSYAAGLVSGGTQLGGLVGLNKGRVEESFFDSSGSGQTAALGENHHAESADPRGYDSTSATLQYNGADVTQDDFDGWNFAGDDAAWRWVAGQWPTLAAFPAEQQRIAVSTPHRIAIANEEDLRKIGVDDAYPLDAHYTLTDNITLRAAFEPIGVNSAPFFGSLDGEGHRIENLSIEQAARRFVGLFSQLGPSSVVRDLMIVSAEVAGGYCTGVLAGRCYGHVEDVSIEGGSVSGDDRYAIGGLTGWNNGSIEGSHTWCEVSGAENVGGLVGVHYGMLETGYALGAVLGTTSVGGLVGWNGGEISGSYASGTVRGENSYIGGLVGKNIARISKSYATGEISGDGEEPENAKYVGGLVGYGSSMSRIEQSYATGGVSGRTDIGGFIGTNEGEISESYFDTTTSGTSNGVGSGREGGIIGYISSASGELYHDNSAVTVNDFSGWDFDGAEATWYWAGSGKWPVFDISIASEEDLRKIGVETDTHPLSGRYKMIADIAIEEGSFDPIGSNDDSFTGRFDGEGHRITDLTILRPEDERYVGFFSKLAESAKLSDVTLIFATDNVGSPNITGRDFLGAVAGTNSGRITNVEVHGATISGDDDIGGVAGENDGTIARSSVHGATISGDDDIGGVAGENDGTIARSSVHGATISGDENIGGVTGENRGAITESYASGMISGHDCIGGLVGFAESASIADSYTDLTVSGNANIGGLVGKMEESTIERSYAIGTVLGNENPGGFVGDTSSGISESYFDTYSSGQVYSVAPTASTSGVPPTGITAYDSSSGSVQYEGRDITQSDFNTWNFSGDEPIWSWDGDGRWPKLAVFSVAHQPEIVAGSATIDISSEEELRKIGVDDAYRLDAHYTLTRDIELHSAFEPIGVNDEPLTGTFDGGGHRIEGLRIVDSERRYVGLFSQIAQSGTVRDLTISQAQVEGEHHTGGLVGRSYGLVTNVSTEGASVSGDNYVGGLVGRNYGSVESSNSAAEVSGKKWVGGLVGKNYDSVADSHASGKVRGYERVGGLLGRNYGRVTASYARAEVIGAQFVGGLVGKSGGNIIGSYAAGWASGDSNIGGLIGYLDSGSVESSYAAGSVSGNEDVGGLVGYAKGSTSASYSSGVVSGHTNVGGLVGYAQSGSISDSYSTGLVLGSASVGGLIGRFQDDTISGNSENNKINASYFDVSHSRQEDGIGFDERDRSTGVSGYDSVTGTVQNNGEDVTQADFADDLGTDNHVEWNFEAAWRWRQDGQWPYLAAFPADQQPEVITISSTTEIALSSEEDLRKIGIDDAYPLDAHYTLTSDIELTDSMDPIGAHNRPFTGSFDGGGHRIEGLTISQSGEYFAGLFSQIATSGAVDDLTIIVTQIEGASYTGGLAGRSYGTLTRIVVQGGTLSGDDYVGGLVGSNGGRITGSDASTSVEGDDNVGGFVGYAGSSSHIIESSASGEISGKNSVGGLVGKNSGSIETSCASAAVSGRYVPTSGSDVSNATLIGGCVGFNDGSITASYASGTVEGNNNVGGLVGENSGSITTSYASAEVSDIHPGVRSTSIGGFAGSTASGSSIHTSYFKAESRNQEGVGSGSDDGVTSRYTASRSLRQSDFDGWTFTGEDALWHWIEGSWPRLAWQNEDDAS